MLEIGFPDPKTTFWGDLSRRSEKVAINWLANIISYWLFIRDPHNGLWNNPHINWVGNFIPYIQTTNHSVFFNHESESNHESEINHESVYEWNQPWKLTWSRMCLWGFSTMKVKLWRQRLQTLSPKLPPPPPPSNKGFIAGLIKGNQWVFINPDHKAGYFLGE